MKFLHLVPTLMNFAVNSPTVTHDHLKNLEGSLIATAPVHPIMAEKFKEKCGKDIRFQECKISNCLFHFNA